MKEINQASLFDDAIDVHCHGVGRFDFTDIENIDLYTIESILRSRKEKCILTLYLEKNRYDHFFELIESYHRGRLDGLYVNILGFGLEGPLLASHGGTPHKGVWNPSQMQWKEIASCGEMGLIYSIFSPDAPVDEIGSEDGAPAKDTAWVAETLLDGGVLPAAGHFLKDDPKRSAKKLQTIFDVIRSWGYGPTITDHLYNDMPHNFRHAWRTKKDKEVRNNELETLMIEDWTLSNIETKLGPVPATMIKNARNGLVKISQNFDGEHVDLEIVRATVNLVGAENMLMMTDSIESHMLAGRELYQHEDSTLLYEEHGIVAAGTQGIHRQIENMLRMGLSPLQIEMITKLVPAEIFKKRKCFFDKKSKSMYI